MDKAQIEKKMAKMKAAVEAAVERAAAKHTHLHGNDKFYVVECDTSYAVMQRLACGCDMLDSQYYGNADGLSLAIARCDYLTARAKGFVPCKKH